MCIFEILRKGQAFRKESQSAYTFFHKTFNFSHPWILTLSDEENVSKDIKIANEKTGIRLIKHPISILYFKKILVKYFLSKEK